MPRAHLVALLVVFALTRLVGGYVADHGELYTAIGQDGVTGDIWIYSQWANYLLDQDVAAYSGVGIEYPPGSLPFLALPQAFRGPAEYETAFVIMMLIIDALGLVGLLFAARRWGSMLGPWLWVVLIPLLGPIVYARLDLVPAVSTIWAASAAAGGAWFATGAWLGFGMLAKIYPGFLLPLGFIAARDRRQFLAGAVLLLVAPLLPFLASLPAVWNSVAGYHLHRGIQIESTWAGWLLLARRYGYPTNVVFNFGAFHVEAPVAPLLELASTLLSLAALAAGAWLVWRAVPRGDGARMIAAMYATLALIMAVGSVFSPQFMVWLFALGAAAACARTCVIREPVLLLLPAAVFTQALFPFLYEGLAPAFPRPLYVLLVRNLLVLASALWAFQRLYATRPLPQPALSQTAAAEVAA